MRHPIQQWSCKGPLERNRAAALHIRVSAGACSLRTHLGCRGSWDRKSALNRTPSRFHSASIRMRKHNLMPGSMFATSTCGISAQCRSAKQALLCSGLACPYALNHWPSHTCTRAHIQAKWYLHTANWKRARLWHPRTAQSRTCQLNAGKCTGAFVLYCGLFKPCVRTMLHRFAFAAHTAHALSSPLACPSSKPQDSNGTLPRHTLPSAGEGSRSAPLGGTPQHTGSNPLRHSTLNWTSIQYTCAARRGMPLLVAAQRHMACCPSMPEKQP